MHYVLTGKIARAHPYALDTTLSVEGAGAEAKATGEAIAEAKKLASDHITNKANPHGVTATQIGLGEVDNTSDKDKPVSTAQAEAIKKAKTDVKAEIEETLTEATGTVNNAFTEMSREIAKKATTQTYSGTLSAGGWSESAPYTQTISVAGVLATDNPLVDVDLSGAENGTGIIEGWMYVGRVTVSGDNEVTAYCYEEKPEVDIPMILKVVR